MSEQNGPTAPHGQVPGQSPDPGRGQGSPQGLWAGAISTPGGRLSVIVAAVLGAVILVAGLGLSAVAIGRVVWDGDRSHMMGEGHDDDAGGHGLGMERWNGNGVGKGNGRGNGFGNGRGGGVLPGSPRGDGAGPGGLGLTGSLHGELTTTGATGESVTMVFQVGEVTAYTADDSLTVRSADDFEATYAITGDTVTSTAAAPAVGAQVRVLATKEGMALTRLAVVERPQS
ncbi:MAG: hypothetical protein WBL35_09570 [Ornithinibacter sp.]